MLRPSTNGAAVIHDSKHWTEGGTGLTNLPPDDFPRYLEAVKRHGNAAFVVSSTRMRGRGRDAPGGSLHFLDGMKTNGNEISAFWRVFDEVKKMSATDSQRTNTAELWAASQRGYDSMIARLIAIIRKEATNGR